MVALTEMVTQIENDEPDKNVKRSVHRAVEALLRRKAATTRDFLAAGEKGRVIEELTNAIDASAVWPVENVEFDVMLTGIKSTLRRGQKAFMQVTADQQPAGFHEWRKRAKDLRYQLTYLHKLWPEVLQGYADSAEELEQTLGDEHNLTVLHDVLKDLGLPKGDAAAMVSVIEKRQSDLRKKALRTGRLLYEETSKDWTRRLARCWQERH
jgi:CHAD domain-containing protein